MTWIKDIPKEWSAGVGIDQELYAGWNPLLQPAQCDRIVKRFDKKLTDGTIFSDNKQQLKDTRRSQVCWIPIQSSTRWLYDYIYNSAVLTNPWDVDIRGFSEQFQYTVYRGEDQSFYDWHRDIGPDYNHRKLTISILLSDPSEFEGGEFELENQVITAFKKKGSAIIFPSILNHRVKPVTSGIRRALVLWITGPRLK